MFGCTDANELNTRTLNAEQNRKVEYLIKWAHYDDEHNSWQPQMVCEVLIPDMVRKYNTEHDIDASAPRNQPAKKTPATERKAAASKRRNATSDGASEQVTTPTSREGRKHHPARAPAAEPEQDMPPTDVKKPRKTEPASDSKKGSDRAVGFAFGHTIKIIERVRKTDSGLVATICWQDASGNELPDRTAVDTHALMNHSWEASKALNKFYEARVTKAH
jgi:hypothetical protein